MKNKLMAIWYIILGRSIFYNSGPPVTSRITEGDETYYFGELE